MSKEDIKLLIKNEYENGTSMSVLSRKYGINLSSIKKWSSQGNWIKKKHNKVTKNNRTKKSNQRELVTQEKDAQIKSDIMNNISKKEVMAKNDISERTYYRKRQSIRQARIEKTEQYLERISQSVYPDLETILENSEKAKRNLIVRSIKEIGSEKIDVKKIQEYNKAFNSINQMVNNVIRTGKMLTPYEILEIEQQLVNEELLQDKLELEKKKIEGEQLKDTKVEFKFKEKEIEELEGKKNE